MSKELLTAEQVKDKLGITDFRSVSKDQLIEFVSSIPDMDKETAIACIQQFPNFKDYSNNMIVNLYKLCDDLLERDEKGNEQTIAAYQQILNELSKQLNKRFLTERKRRKIIEEMVDVADKIAELDRSKQNFREHLLKIASGVATFAIAVGGAILGVRSLKK